MMDCHFELCAESLESAHAAEAACFFRDLHTITTYFLFPSRYSFMNTVVSGKASPISNC